MKRLGLSLVAAVLIGIAIGVGSLFRARPVDPEARPAVRQLTPVVRQQERPATPESRGAVEPEPATAVHAMADRVALVTAQCGLVADVACEGDRCVAVTAMPDLDRPLGWAPLALQSPRFVGSTALRDLGVPADVLPCGRAIAGLTGDWGAVLLERTDGGEVWCGLGGPPDGFDARRLCVRAATASGLGERFLDPQGRVLRFDRGR